MNGLAIAHASSLPKYARVADSLRAEIAEGALLPGEAAPSGAELARVTGYSVLTCRRALRSLIKEGVLIPGASANARPRIPSRTPTPGEQALADAKRDLSAFLAARRRAAGLTQLELAEIVGVSLTTIGHAETGRLWQARRFWEHADKGISAGGALLARHDAYRAAATPRSDETETIDNAAPKVAVAAFVPVTCVTITWADGSVTTAYPPHAACALGADPVTPARSADATPAH